MLVHEGSLQKAHWRTGPKLPNVSNDRTETESALVGNYVTCSVCLAKQVPPIAAGMLSLKIAV
jgi:hypothetical protein